MTPTIRNASATVALAALITVGTVGCSSEDVKTSDAQTADTAVAQTTEPTEPAGNGESMASEDSQPQPTSASDTAEAAAAGSTAGDDSSEALPTNAGSYADAFVRAFGETSDIGVQKMGTERAVSDLNDHGDSAASHWDRSGTSGAAGSVEVDYTNTETHEHMKVLVNNEKASNGDEHAVTDVKFEK